MSAALLRGFYKAHLDILSTIPIRDPAGVFAKYATEAMTRARFDTRERTNRLTPIAPRGIAKMRVARGSTPMRPTTKVPAKPRTP